jgi:hypothetical protein
VEDMKKINFIAIGIILISALIVSAAVAAEVKKIDLGKPALLVIDVANDVCDEKGVLNKLGVWKYGKEHGTFKIDYLPGMPDVPKRGFIYGAKVKFGDFFIEHTWGAKPFAGLEPGEGQLEVIKKRFNSFHNTNLKPLLDALGVDTLMIGTISLLPFMMPLLDQARECAIFSLQNFGLHGGLKS